MEKMDTHRRSTPMRCTQIHFTSRLHVQMAEVEWWSEKEDGNKSWEAPAKPFLARWGLDERAAHAVLETPYLHLVPPSSPYSLGRCLGFGLLAAHPHLVIFVHVGTNNCRQRSIGPSP